MTTFTPHPYQQEAIDHGYYRLSLCDQIGTGLFLDPGLGKTAITLSVIKRLRRDGLAGKVLVVAPLRVVYNVWPDEIRKWRFGLSTTILHGSPETRRNRLLTPSDVYLINPEGLVWLEKQPGIKFDLLILDESTKFKSWTAQRTKALRRLLGRCKRRIILTGTPAPNTVQDLFAQVYVVDDGETLGKSLTYFRSLYMQPGGYQGRGWLPRPNAAKQIAERIAPMVLTMKAEDHLDMPPRVDNEIWVDLPSSARRVYDSVENALFALLDNGQELTASSAGAVYMMCRGLANGGSYYKPDDPLGIGLGERQTVDLHDAKIEAIGDLVEELNGKPALIAYQFHHDADRLLKRFPGSPVLRGGTKPKEASKIIADWNSGKVPTLLVQPQALSHGVNLQHGGNDLVWMGLSDQLEIYLQLNCRLYRQGVRGQVRVHHVLAKKTVDVAIWDRIKGKQANQATLLEALKAYRRGR